MSNGLMLFVEVDLEVVVGKEPGEFEGYSAYALVPEVSVLQSILKASAVKLLADANNGVALEKKDQEAVQYITSSLFTNRCTEFDYKRQLASFFASVLGGKFVDAFIPEDTESMDWLTNILREKDEGSKEIADAVNTAFDRAVSDDTVLSHASAFGTKSLKRALVVESPVDILGGSDLGVTDILPTKDYTLIVYNKDIDGGTGTFLAGVALRKTAIPESEIVHEIKLNVDAKKE